ncbi:MAG: 2-amino-4-hydroxy-6-hydroxymethyldihydropteridine diphosphokinase [Bacteroidales bacterium]|nr:2-amino-4-hydroxy-6-hydroxymethyldihydropteridine diphosphokinase [Bacteroidales bacterium]
MTVYLSLGTNKGNRERNIRRALCLLNIALGKRYKAISDIVNTKAAGFDGPDFLNCVAAYDLRLSPGALLRRCKRIERLMGRRDAPEYAPDGSRIYHDRVIDIDILLYGDRKVDVPGLTIPHPQLDARPFFGEMIAQVRQKLGITSI